MHDHQQPLAGQMSHVRTGFHRLPDGARMRYALCEPEGTPHATILIGPGRREFIEKKYAESGKEFLERGFRVIIFEWRGQGLSSRALSGSKHQRDYISDFGLHMTDLSSLLEDVVKPNMTGPLVLFGHSMGSHLFLRWLTEYPGAPIAGAILTAPMLALAGPLAHISATVISWGALKLHHNEDYAPMQQDYGMHERIFIGNPLTHDPLRYAIIEQYFDAYPNMTVGGVTWGWLHAAVKSMSVTQRRHNLERITFPILTITGGKDRVTPPTEIGRYLKMIPSAENVFIPEALHDVINEADSYRLDAWQHIDQFLRRLKILT